MKKIEANQLCVGDHVANGHVVKSVTIVDAKVRVTYDNDLEIGYRIFERVGVERAEVL